MTLRRLLALAVLLMVVATLGIVKQVQGDTPHSNLPPAMLSALAGEYGRYEGTISPSDLLKDLQSADVVCIGEAHYDADDMETAFELVRLMAQRKQIALAVERLSYDLQPRLDYLNTIAIVEERQTEIAAILESKDYQTVWGTHSFDQNGFPVNTPSQPIFEAMVKWASQNRVPLIGLDVSLAERADGAGDNLPYRNELWATRINGFLARNSGTHYLVVAVGGIDHMNNASESLPSRLKRNPFDKIISIGQRDAMYKSYAAIRVQEYAGALGIRDLIVRHPESAIVKSNGRAEYPSPPDYWIAVHQPDTWN